jgi:NADPH:quinone reductase-like Zn-dependent oxidoreductase
MKATVIANYGGPEELVIRELPTPVPQENEVLIKVRAFGINRAETYMRKGQWPEIAPVSGIECVGEVVEDTTGTMRAGETVAAVMGGIGRNRNGSYAEYVTVPATNVFRLKTDLPWAELAAIPESYATAWSCLHSNLRIESGQVLLVRGATSALGQAAINIAKDAGLTVLATTRREDRAALLTAIGADWILIENGHLAETVRQSYPDGIDAVLELVGSSTLVDSLAMVAKGGRVCMAGFLGGGEPVTLNPLGDIPSGVDFSFYGSFMLGAKDFPLSEIPMQCIVDKAAGGAYKAKPAKVFSFDQIPDAHRAMESNQSGGKIVITLE